MPQPTLNVKDKDGNGVTIFTQNPNGQALKADSQPVVLASDQPILPDTTGSGSITTQNLNPNSGVPTAGSTVTLSGLDGRGAVAIQVTGTYTGALTVQATVDGTNWIAAPSVLRLSTNAQSATIASATQDIFQVEATGFAQVRVSANAAVTGTAVVTMRATAAVGLLAIDAPLPAGTNVIGALSSNQSVNCAQMNGVAVTMGNGVAGTGVQRVCVASDNTAFTVNLGTGGTGATSLGKAEDAAAASGDTGVPVWGVRRDALTTSASGAADYNEMCVDRFGSQLVRSFEKHARTYRAASNFTPAATPTDIWDLFGNGTTTVVVTRIKITGIQTTAGNPEVLVVKRSTANTVGTRVAQTAVPLDAGDAAASSTPGHYTANPTTGTLVGAVARQYVLIVPAATAIQGGVEFNFGDKGKGLLLSGTAQGVAVNLNGVTLAGGQISIEVEWYEF